MVIQCLINMGVEIGRTYVIILVELAGIEPATS
jgi:hypothetical protein